MQWCVYGVSFAVIESGGVAVSRKFTVEMCVTEKEKATESFLNFFESVVTLSNLY